jgi:hypothetical protein
VVTAPSTVAYLLAPFMAGGGSARPTLRDAVQENPSLVTDHARFGLSELIVHTPNGPLAVPPYAGWDACHCARSAIHILVDGLRT